MLKQLLKRALGLGNNGSMAGTPVEQPASHYDDVYQDSEEYRLAYPSSRYYFVWSVIVDRVRRLGARRVLEIGCGAGQLASFLVEQGIESYVGLDFSAKALELARNNVPSGVLVHGDARTSDVYEKYTYDVIISTEVLEHIEADLDVVSRFPPGTRCICSVPSFPYRSHVRYFRNAEEVAARYRAFFDDFSVFSLRMPKDPSSYYFLFEGTRNVHRNA